MAAGQPALGGELPALVPRLGRAGTAREPAAPWWDGRLPRNHPEWLVPSGAPADRVNGAGEITLFGEDGVFVRSFVL